MERYGDATGETSFWMLDTVQQKRQQENSRYPLASLLMKLFGFERFITLTQEPAWQNTVSQTCKRTCKGYEAPA
jgi:hypothetical protein